MTMDFKRRIFWVFWKLSVILKRLHLRSKKCAYHLYICMCLLTFCATIAYFLMLWSYTDVPDRVRYFSLVQKKLWESIGKSSGNIGCVFPNLDPYSEEAMRFSRDVSKITCEGEDWVDCYMSECHIKEKIRNRYRNVVCNFKEIIFVNDYKRDIGPATRVTGEDKFYFSNSDHVKVSCTGMDMRGLGLVASRWQGNKAGFRPITRKSPPGREDSLNVLILAFDSTSRFGFMRKMPTSYKVLTKKLKATILKGFHILGDGTPAALFPLLSGRTELEHPNSARKEFANGKFLDPELFIFHQIKADGYHTAYFEDMPWVGSFQYRHNGFNVSPADHYLRTFFAEQDAIGLKMWTRSKFCQGSMPQYLLMLNLSRQFMDVPGKKFCFTIISDITHDDFNMISAADDDFAEFLREFQNSGKLKDTLLIVMGDHGSRFAPIRDTYQGRFEERLPLMAIVLPEKLVQQRPEALLALKENEMVVTTAFDIHTTVLDVMGLNALANKFKVMGSDLPRGVSVLEPIPKSRVCGQAGILPHWCVCTKWSNVSIVDPLYSRAGKFLAQFINKLTLDQRDKCVERTLTSIEWVMRHGNNEDVLKYRGSKDDKLLFASFVTKSDMVKPYVEDYQAKIVMAPGRAIYEGSMKYNVRKNRFTMSESDISRITAYGNEPDCVSRTHPLLNKYCYCKKTEVKQTVTTETNIK